MNQPQMEYRNSALALNKLDNSLGEIVVLEALAGYGKTAFLQEVARQRKTQDWLAEYIPLTQNMSPADVWTTMLHRLSGRHDLHLQGLDDTLAWLSYNLPRRKRLAVLFDDVHALRTETLTWVQTEFALKLKEELFSISQGNFLLVFSGQNIPGSPTSWSNHRRIDLLPFDRNTIQQFVDAVPSPELQEFIQIARHKKWLIEKMIRLCGGHPRALLQLLQEIRSGAWQPHPRRSEEYDRAIFEQHIETEINRLTRNLSESYRSMLEGLSIFRSIHSSIVKIIQQDDAIQNQDDPLAVVRQLRTSNLLIARESILVPVIRNGLTMRMMLNDRQRYLSLNQRAQLAYQNWLARFDQERPFEDARGYAAEAIYHCLCHSNQPTVLHDCLRTVIQRLDQLLLDQGAQGFSSDQMLVEHLADDDDINTMLSDYGWSIEQQIAESRQAGAIAAQAAVSPAGAEYAAGIVAILDANRAVVGTGFLLQYQVEWLVVTCTHILQKLNLQTDRTVQLSHFSPDIGEFEAEVLQFQPPSTPASQWCASEDVSILRPIALLSQSGLQPYSLHDGQLHPGIYPSGERSLCFGYAQDRVNRGDYIAGLAFANEVASGFVALTNGGTEGVRPGVSGAPWANTETQTIVGMVQSIAANGSRAYLIPASVILRVIASVVG